jgi:hypothetical protein
MRTLLNQTQSNRERGKERGFSAGRRDEGAALGIQNRDRDSEGGQLRPELERGFLRGGLSAGKREGAVLGIQNRDKEGEQPRWEDRIGSNGGRKTELEAVDEARRTDCVNHWFENNSNDSCIGHETCCPGSEGTWRRKDSNYDENDIVLTKMRPEKRMGCDAGVAR